MTSNLLSIREIYQQQILNEGPVAADYESFSSTLQSGIGSAPGSGYLIGNIADQLGVSKEVVVGMISKTLYNKVFPGGENPANTEEEYRQAIVDALTDVVREVEQSKGIKLKGANNSIKQYTSRVISSLGQSVKQYGAKVSKPQVVATVKQIAQSEEPKATATETETVPFQDTSLNEIHTLHSAAYDDFVEQITKVNKRNSKYGLPEVTVEQTGQSFKKHKDGNGFYKLIEFRIQAPKLVLPGDWAFIASIDHLGDSNIINKAPGAELNDSLHDLYGSAKSSICDHCGKRRNRTSTYIIRNSAGELKRVGKQCLQDYLPGGADSASKVLAFAQTMSDILRGLKQIKLGGSEDEGGISGSHSAQRSYPLKEIVSAAIQIIKTLGYVKANSGEYTDSSREATSQTVLRFLQRPEDFTEDSKNAYDALIAKSKVNATPLINKAVEWIQKYSSDQAKGGGNMQDYYRNISALYKTPDEYISTKHFGYVVSAVSIFLKNYSKDTNVSKDEKPVGDFVGTPGMPIGQLSYADRNKLKKANIDITKFPYIGPIPVVATTDSASFERQSFSYYDSGISYRVSFEDDQGNKYTLFSANADNINKGDKLILKRAIIKKHNEYTTKSGNTIKQNIISRAVFDTTDEVVSDSVVKTFNALVERYNVITSSTTI